MKYLLCLAVLALGLLDGGTRAARAQEAPSCARAAAIYAQGEAFAASGSGGIDRIVSDDPARLLRAKEVYASLPPPGDLPDADGFVFYRPREAWPTALVFLRGGKPACAFIITRGDGGASLTQAIFGDPS